MGLATLVTALHWQPFQRLPMLFPPLLLFSSYLHVAGFRTDAAGTAAAWSGLYVLLAVRRRRRPAAAPAPALRRRFTARGGVRAAAVALGVVNCVAGGWVYATGDREAEDVERRERNRWGVYRE